MQRQPNTLKGINMKNLLLPAKIIGTAWIIFLIFIRPLAPSSEQDEWIWFALNAVGSASIAFVYGYSRGKKGLNAGWIAKVFLALFMLLPLLSVGNSPLIKVLIHVAITLAFIVLCLYLPYRAGSELGYQEYEDTEDDKAA